MVEKHPSSNMLHEESCSWTFTCTFTCSFTFTFTCTFTCNMCQVEAAIQSVEKLLKDYGHPPLPRKVFFIFFIVPRSYHVQSWFCLDLHEVTLAFSKRKLSEASVSWKRRLTSVDGSQSCWPCLICGKCLSKSKSSFINIFHKYFSVKQICFYVTQIYFRHKYVSDWRFLLSQLCSDDASI